MSKLSDVLTISAEQSLHRAVEMSRDAGFKYATTGHLLLALLKDDCVSREFMTAELGHVTLSRLVRGLDMKCMHPEETEAKFVQDNW